MDRLNLQPGDSLSDEFLGINMAGFLPIEKACHMFHKCHFFLLRVISWVITFGVVRQSYILRDMNTQLSQEKNKLCSHNHSRIMLCLAFFLPFVIAGGVDFICQAMDARGFDTPDYGSCWFYFFLFGGIAGTIGFAIARASMPLVKWRH